MFRKIQHIHFVGIGGQGMNGIAEVLLNLGYRVSGSDLNESEVLQRLRKAGGHITIGHSPSNIKGAQVVVISSAVSPDNVEVVAARQASIPVIQRAEMLAELMRLKYGIAIAGAHGKTTTTSMVAGIIASAGLDPTVVIGGKLNSLGSNAKLGQSEFLVAEADESDGSFLKLSPTIAIVTNIDAEHLDYYNGLDDIKKTFLSFINKVPFYGIAILCADNENVKSIIPYIEKRYMTYSIRAKADITAYDISTSNGKSNFRVLYKGIDMGEFNLPIPGVHNISNALASIGAAIELDIKTDDVRRALGDFSGVERRFQIIGRINKRNEKKSNEDIIIVDDYGHHPTEVRATLSAAKEGWGKRPVVIFQPHRYTRTRDLIADFAGAFDNADVLLITDIYPAGEKPIEGVTGEKLYNTICRHGHRNAVYIPDKTKINNYIKDILMPGDMVITLGAGDIWKIGRKIISDNQDTGQS
ncbi:MAG: UDP-N-acetylmuramate--L-alanine ligase [Nitrospirae bacterium RIFCSPLOWO2_02_42_7]|nr:MAG: UDP-N-acetylmuramate--L-alanine ligase [Nitrospirae bacterium RIFCSPLOWO2_02_42_7]